MFVVAVEHAAGELCSRRCKPVAAGQPHIHLIAMFAGTNCPAPARSRPLQNLSKEQLVQSADKLRSVIAYGMLPRPLAYADLGRPGWAGWQSQCDTSCAAPALALFHILHCFRCAPARRTEWAKKGWAAACGGQKNACSNHIPDCRLCPACSMAMQSGAAGRASPWRPSSPAPSSPSGLSTPPA